MSSLRALKENWEGFAQLDPLAAICTDPVKRDGKWTPEEFFETGRQEVRTILQHVQSLGLPTDNTSPALDFGCGVGRLTAALSEYFDKCVGVDISPTMIQLASRFHEANSRCTFLLNQSDNLLKFADDSFGFIYSSIVLQHMKGGLARRYLCELIRVLKPAGVLVFQVPDLDLTPWVQRIRSFVGLRRKIDRLLGRKTFHSFRMEMHCLPEPQIRRLLANRGVRIVDVKLTNSTDHNFNGKLHFLERAPQRGYVSKQYCVVKA
jgi:SAM-dependent methyltransferase